MGQIRRQTILSSISTYLGFLVGALNTYLFVRAGSGSFTPAEYGLTRIFTDVGQIMFAVGSFGVANMLYKFYPYYKDNLDRKDNDLLSLVLGAVTVGAVLVLVGGLIFEPFIVRKFSARSALFVSYYHLVFPFGLGLLFFSVLESYAWTVKHSVFSTFLREAAVRMYALLLIIPYYLNWIDFDTFIKLFAFQYVTTAVTLWIYLGRRKFMHLTFRISRVTRRFKKKIIAMSGLSYGAAVIQIVAQAFDGILIAGLIDLKTAGIYTFLLYVANIIQVPLRSVQAVTIPHLSQAWKDKDIERIRRIYQRTSINLLILSLFLFLLIWLCTLDAFAVLPIQQAYKQGLNVILLLGIARIIDGGTGVNGQIIGTSTYYRFEFGTGVLLLALRIPLNYVLIKAHGIAGSAIADLISLVVYNGIRIVFLSRKFHLQPFSYKTALALLYSAAAYLLVYACCYRLHGWAAIFSKTILFTGIYGGAVLVSRLTPDAQQVWTGLKEKATRAFGPRP